MFCRKKQNKCFCLCLLGWIVSHVYFVHTQFCSLKLTTEKIWVSQIWFEYQGSLWAVYLLLTHTVLEPLKGVKWGQHNYYYYSFKIFPCFWLVETTCIIHHNQLLFTKFGKKLHHIESMTSKVQPAADYWTIDQKKNWGRDCAIFVSPKMAASSFRNLSEENIAQLLMIKTVRVSGQSIFWMNNKATVTSEFSFRGIWIILQISENVIHSVGLGR